MIDLDSAAIRLDPDAWDALIATAQDPNVDAPAEVAAALEDERLNGVLNVVLEPAVELSLVVAGPVTRLEHRGWQADGALVLLLALRPGLLQLMATPVEFLTATLVRLTRMKPRHLPERDAVPFPAARLEDLTCAEPTRRAEALALAGADFAWRLDLTWDGRAQRLTAVDGERGLHLANPGEDLLTPVTNTFCYRILSTALVE